MINIAVTAVTSVTANGLAPTASGRLTRHRRPDCVVRHFPTPITIIDSFVASPAAAQPAYMTHTLGHVADKTVDGGRRDADDDWLGAASCLGTLEPEGKRWAIVHRLKCWRGRIDRSGWSPLFRQCGALSRVSGCAP